VETKDAESDFCRVPYSTRILCRRVSPLKYALYHADIRGVADLKEELLEALL
jgi:hypothetical protein